MAFTRVSAIVDSLTSFLLAFLTPLSYVLLRHVVLFNRSVPIIKNIQLTIFQLIMIKQTIIIPGASHLDTFRALVESQFPVGSFILDKKLTGCGATTMFLRDSTYTILVCPRILLMDCKANDPEFKGLVHEFRKADGFQTPTFRSRWRFPARCASWAWAMATPPGRPPNAPRTLMPGPSP